MDKNQEKKSIFRQKAMDRISSPEQLDQYLTVTGPGVWLPLITVIVLLIGGLIWMTLGSIDVTISVAVQATNDGVVCYVPTNQKTAAVQRGEIVIAGEHYALKDAGFATLLVDEAMNGDVRRTGSLMLGDTVAPLSVNAELMQGIYQGEVTVEAVHPITYILN